MISFGDVMCIPVEQCANCGMLC